MAERYFIDLFAGCGGLSLGLEMAGFSPLLFSEINLDASKTYMANRLHEDVIPIGDVYSLTDANLAHFKAYWEMTRGISDIDLVCGGPPCQGFSGIGHRRTFKLDKEEIPSNQLYQEMLRVIRCVRPKMFLFENVRGLLTSKWNEKGKNGEIFRQVLGEFQTIPGYYVRWQLVHAKDYGVPQNRPRVLIVGIREDMVRSAQQGTLDLVVSESPARFNARLDPKKPTAVEDGFVPKPSGVPPTLEELLSDLIDPDYLGKDATTSYVCDPQSSIQKALRTRLDGTLMKKGSRLTEQEYSKHSPNIRKKFAYMIAHNGEIPEEMRTKKFAQRVFPRTWGEDGPSITACSLPEDYVHFEQPRAPTVREMARIQMFPDWYVFCGARTTGGRRRAGDPSKGLWLRDVPRYTQIGNAVPVGLAHKLGLHFMTILDHKIRLNDA